MYKPHAKLTFVGLWFGFGLWIEGDNTKEIEVAVRTLEKKLITQPATDAEIEKEVAANK